MTEGDLTGFLGLLPSALGEGRNPQIGSSQGCWIKPTWPAIKHRNGQISRAVPASCDRPGLVTREIHPSIPRLKLPCASRASDRHQGSLSYPGVAGTKQEVNRRQSRLPRKSSLSYSLRCRKRKDRFLNKGLHQPSLHSTFCRHETADFHLNDAGWPSTCAGLV